MLSPESTKITKCLFCLLLHEHGSTELRLLQEISKAAEGSQFMATTHQTFRVLLWKYARVHSLDLARHLL